MRKKLQDASMPVVAPSGTSPSPLGRPRDPSRDAKILEAAIDTLADFGYERMTMDMVASRAGASKATVYRRWSSKATMVIDALGWLKQSQVDLASLPDTGTLRGDLLALFKLQPSVEEERKLRAMGGLASLLSEHPELAEAGNAAIVEPWVEANRILICRALDRGEFAVAVDVEVASQVIPSMAAYRALVQRKPFDRKFLVSLVDGVLLPAFRNHAPRKRDGSDAPGQGPRATLRTKLATPVGGGSDP